MDGSRRMPQIGGRHGVDPYEVSACGPIGMAPAAAARPFPTGMGCFAAAKGRVAGGRTWSPPVRGMGWFGGGANRCAGSPSTHEGCGYGAAGERFGEARRMGQTVCRPSAERIDTGSTLTGMERRGVKMMWGRVSDAS
jgi:hypothetical protein